MMIARRRVQALALLGVLAIATQAQAQFTCSIVAVQGGMAAGGGTFSSRFAEPVDCNDTGDTLFVARKKGPGEHDKLFKYPSAEIIAAANGPSVMGWESFRASRVFDFWSLNNANDVAFRGMLGNNGVGVIKNPSGMGTDPVGCARNGDPAPNGGNFVGFPHVAQINDGGKVAILADRTDPIVNPRCAYVCDCPNACVPKVRVGSPTQGGKEICQIYRIGLGDSAAIVLSAAIGDAGTCANPIDAILIKTDAGGDALEIAKVGDACPMPPGGPGGSFKAFSHDVPPLVNAGDKVGFQATCEAPSNPRTTGLFLWEPPTKAIA